MAGTTLGLPAACIRAGYCSCETAQPLHRPHLLHNITGGDVLEHEKRMTHGGGWGLEIAYLCPMDLRAREMSNIPDLHAATICRAP